jgi:hypothetical protein
MKYQHLMSQEAELSEKVLHLESKLVEKKQLIDKLQIEKKAAKKKAKSKYFQPNQTSYLPPNLTSFQQQGFQYPNYQAPQTPTKGPSTNSHWWTGNPSPNHNKKFCANCGVSWFFSAKFCSSCGAQ